MYLKRWQTPDHRSFRYTYISQFMHALGYFKISTLIMSSFELFCKEKNKKNY